MPLAGSLRARVAGVGVAAALAVSAAAGVGVAARPFTESPASPGSSSPDVTPQMPAPASLIEGVVVSGSGKPVDDVSVFAIDAQGERVASALSYASQRREGPAHGYFFLAVPAGEYTVLLRKKGYSTTAIDEVQVGKRRTSLGEIVISAAPAKSSTAAFARAQRVSAGEPVLVRVRTELVGVKEHATGRVVVHERVGRRGSQVLATALMGSADRGMKEIRVRGLGVGTHVLWVEFVPGGTAKKSVSDRFTVVVEKPTKRTGRGHGSHSGS